MRSTKRLAVLLLTAVLVAVGLTVPVSTALAERHVLRVTLLGGAVITVTVDVPPGTPLDQIHIPGVSLPVVSVQDLTPAAPTTTTSSTATQTQATPTQTQTTPSATTQTQTQTTPTQTQTTTTTTTSGGHHAHHAGGSDSSSAGGQKSSDSANAKAGPEPQGSSGDGGKTKHKKKKHQVSQKDRQQQLDQAAANTHHKLRDSGGAPTPDNPTFSLATPGAAPLGVPNFFIDRFRVPPFLLSIYQAAGIQYGIPWQVLAGINEIETDYGRNLNVSTAGAVGWMQFLPSTWRQWGVDANNDGRKDPYNPVDAIFAAARYLKAAGGDQDIKKAIFAYNHADWYVQSVLLRARLLGGLPDALVGSLTGLTQGHFPIAAQARYADDLNESQATSRVHSGNAAVPVESNSTRKGIDIYSREGAPAIAVQDGKVLKIGTNGRLGRYLVLQDVYGNRYTYAHLGSVSKYYAVPKPETVTHSAGRRELEVQSGDKAPSAPATAGVQRAKPSTNGAAANAAADAAAAHTKRATTRPHGPTVATKERLFAHPDRPANRSQGGKAQAAAAAKPSFTTFKDYFTVALGLKRNDVELKQLKPGSQVIAGTILGRVGATEPGKAPHLYFEVRPAGKGTPRIDPKPILDGWKLLEATAVYRAAGKNPFVNGAPSVGQVLLMSKETLEQRVLNDPHIDIYPCGRRDIAGGQIDRRVLATLEFLVASGLDPSVSALKCGHSYLTTSGNVSEHSSGNAVDIASINGIPIAGHQGAGSITDITIRRLLTLQGTMKPHQIISLMTFRGADNTLSLPDHWNHIHVGFHPMFGSNQKLGAELATVLKPEQWTKLVARLGDIPNPTVPVKPSRFAIRDGHTGSGD